MPWKTVTGEELAKKHGLNYHEIRRKQKIITIIINARKKKKLSQVALAKKLGFSQARMAQIESYIGTRKITFDALFKILDVLGVNYDISTIDKAA